MAKRQRRTGRGANMGNDSQKAKDMQSTGKKWLTLPEGISLFNEEEDTTYKMDFLPYVVKNIKEHPEGDAMSDDVWYRFPYRVHRRIGPDNKDLICPETFGKACPRCERMREIYNDTSLSSKKAKNLASKYSPSRRSLYLVVIKGGSGEGWDKNLKNKKFIFEASDYYFFKLLEKELGLNDPDMRNFACLESGYTLKVRFSSDSFQGNTFAVPDRIDFEPRKDYPESLLDKHPDLADIIKSKLPTYEEMVEADEGGKPTSTTRSGNTSHDFPDEDEIDDMDYDELSDLVDDHDLSSEIDPDDYDEDDEDDFRDAIKEIINQNNQDQYQNDAGVSSNFPSEDDIECMDYDELVEVVDDFGLDDIDPDDYDEDDEDEVDDLREEIIKITKQSTGNDPSIGDEIEQADDFVDLRKICKNNNIFGSVDFKKYKKKPEKLKKKMLKILEKGTGSSAGKCPSGHTFGEDWADYDECDKATCKVFKECWKKNEADNDIPY